MRKVFSCTIALLAGVSASAASAGVMTMPMPPVESSYVSVAAVQMMVTHSYAHLREKPTSHSALVATLKQGTKVDVLEKVAGLEHGKWAHVQVGGQEGYIALNLLK
jgi:uncharacterized protein YgiM (DUF1202 family)